MGPEVAGLAEILAKSTLPPLSKSDRQAAYLRRLREGPILARVVKVFDRFNNLACLQKSPTKGSGYLTESRRDYLPLARDLDPGLGDRMGALLGSVRSGPAIP